MNTNRYFNDEDWFFKAYFNFILQRYLCSSLKRDSILLIIKAFFICFIQTFYLYFPSCLSDLMDGSFYIWSMVNFSSRKVTLHCKYVCIWYLSYKVLKGIERTLLRKCSCNSQPHFSITLQFPLLAIRNHFFISFIFYVILELGNKRDKTCKSIFKRVVIIPYP